MEVKVERFRKTRCGIPVGSREAGRGEMLVGIGGGVVQGPCCCVAGESTGDPKIRDVSLMVVEICRRSEKRKF